MGRKYQTPVIALKVNNLSLTLTYLILKFYFFPLLPNRFNKGFYFSPDFFPVDDFYYQPFHSIVLYIPFFRE